MLEDPSTVVPDSVVFGVLGQEFGGELENLGGVLAFTDLARRFQQLEIIEAMNQNILLILQDQLKPYTLLFFWPLSFLPARSLARRYQLSELHAARVDQHH